MSDLELFADDSPPASIVDGLSQRSRRSLRVSA